PRTSEPGVIYGADFELPVPPGRSVTGVVRDDRTGRPVEGMEVAATAGQAVPITAVTDREGRYELPGWSKWARYQVTVRRRPTDLPYLAAMAEAGDEPGLGPVRLDIPVRRGIPLHVRVTDKATGAPAHGLVLYLPLYPNSDLPGSLLTGTFSFARRLANG